MAMNNQDLLNSLNEIELKAEAILGEISALKEQLKD